MDTMVLTIGIILVLIAIGVLLWALWPQKEESSQSSPNEPMNANPVSTTPPTKIQTPGPSSRSYPQARTKGPSGRPTKYSGRHRDWDLDLDDDEGYRSAAFDTHFGDTRESSGSFSGYSGGGSHYSGDSSGSSSSSDSGSSISSSSSDSGSSGGGSSGD